MNFYRRVIYQVITIATSSKKARNLQVFYKKAVLKNLGIELSWCPFRSKKGRHSVSSELSYRAPVKPST